MKKIETIWHEILQEALEHGAYRHTQQDIARKIGCSLSTVHHALEGPSAIGAVRKESKFFILRDFWKLLLYWGSVRRLDRDIIASARIPRPVRELEGLALPRSVFAAFTAACHHLGEPPADYDKAYFYLPAEDREAFLRRFGHPPSPAQGGLRRAGGQGPHNVFALRMPDGMERSGSWTTLPQTYVDIWNLSDWYAQDFTRALEKHMESLFTTFSA